MFVVPDDGGGRVFHTATFARSAWKAALARAAIAMLVILTRVRWGSSGQGKIERMHGCPRAGESGVLLATHGGTMRYVRRSLEPVLLGAAGEFPVVVLTGPRQSGKTTLLRRLFSESHGYVSLDLPDVRASASADPRGFLALHPPPVVFDEVQAVPELFPYLKAAVDENRERPGQFILTGSQNLLLGQGITESLAGRAAVLQLMPFSNRELAGLPDDPLPWQEGTRKEHPRQTHPYLWDKLIRGYYPEIATDPDRDSRLWHASYVQTYLERDVRSLRNIGDLGRFQLFLRALAARNAQVLNLSNLSRDIGITVNSVKAWLSVLEASYQVYILRPFFVNVGKRLIKTPKVYFTDLGTLCYLLGFHDPEQAMESPLAGSLFETAVVDEVLKALLHQGIEPRMYYWRTLAGAEVDLVLEKGDELLPIEVKASTTPKPETARHLRVFKHDFPERVLRGYVIHPGELTLPLGDGFIALPFARV